MSEKISCSTVVDCLCDLFEKQKLFSHEDIVALKKDFYTSSVLRFEDFLMHEGLIEKEDLLRVLGIFYQTEAVDTQGFVFDHHLMGMFPHEEMMRNMFIPYQRDPENDDILIVLAANPHDPDLLEIIGEHVSYDIISFVSLGRDIEDAIKDYYDEPLYEQEQDSINSDDECREQHPAEIMIGELKDEEDRQKNE